MGGFGGFGGSGTSGAGSWRAHVGTPPPPPREARELARVQSLAQKLGIPEKPATKAELNKIFKDLPKKYHPDKGGDPEKMKQLTEWHGYLKNKLASYHPLFQQGFIEELSKIASV